MNAYERKKVLELSYKELPLSEELPQLIVDMHLNGINMRYLLFLLGFVKLEKSKVLITTELVARSLKNFIRQKWRELKLCDLDEYYDDSPYKLIASQFFNAIFSPSHNLQLFDRFWSLDIPKIIQSQNYPLPSNEFIPQINDIIKELRHWVDDDDSGDDGDNDDDDDEEYNDDDDDDDDGIDDDDDDDGTDDDDE